MSKKNVFVVLLSMLFGSLLLSACGGEADTSETDQLDEVEQVLNLALAGEPESLDVAKGSDNNSAQVLMRVMEPLTRLEVNEEGETVVVPGAAKSWEVCDDGLEWTFHLRDAKWSDGEPLVAEHFEYGIKRILNPETASPNSTLLNPIKNASKVSRGELAVEKAGVEATDDKTLKITLEDPVPYFLSLTTGRAIIPQREDIIEKYGSSYGTQADKIVYCGPFKVDEWVHNSSVTLSKNEKYWDNESVNLEEVNLKIINEESALMGELQNGNIDIATAGSIEWIEQLDEHDSLKSSTQLIPRTSYVFMNHEIELFSNRKVRQAFSIALDREEIQDNIHDGIKEAAYGWVAPPVDIEEGVSFRDQVGTAPLKELIDENNDPKALFEEGLEELGKDPNDITVTIMLPSGQGEDFAEYLQQVFSEELGITVELDPAEWPVFQERNRELDYEMGFKSWGSHYNDPAGFLDLWLSDNDTVPIGWACSDYDELVLEAAVSMCEEERLEKFKEAEKYLLKEESAMIPYAYHTENLYKHEYVKGVMQPDFGMLTIRNAYIEK
ncbi:peptide ABC transporter substrate-binding protein [Natranaerobius trueperi]|uniref:Peptide ABC transporter substrate-binding protein n=1 Tax=Natranaerobius trueperi TaxID=759412 RepID=A0A226BY45_9FIRM|nr:peptide ABC transporter substrate-binding protein [Natranaerobius trueperi]OWZ83692.1 peptide ABC transporter substrate-binding protein [Natranaerobius trueperi]